MAIHEDKDLITNSYLINILTIKLYIHHLKLQN